MGTGRSRSVVLCAVLVAAGVVAERPLPSLGSLFEEIEAEEGASADAAEAALAWPEVCRPLFERREGNNYAWSSWCRGYSYGGAEHRRSLLCAVEGRWHHSTACELYRIASDCVDKPCGGASGSDGGAATAETLRMGLRRGQASLPRGAGEMMEVLLNGALPVIVESAPGERLTFEAFLSMYIVADLCMRGQHEGVQRIFHLRPHPLGREGCRDLIVEHMEHLYEGLAHGGLAPPPARRADAHPKKAAAKAAEAVRRHIVAMLPVGPLGVADQEPTLQGHYDKLPADEVWARFVVRAPRSQRTDVEGAAWASMQEAWGWQNAWSAVKLAGRLDEMLGGEDDGEHLDAWLEALGAERQAMLDGRDHVEGDQRQVGYRRWRATQRTLTPISGAYRPMWRAALLRRAAGAEAAALFALPSGEDAARGWRCGAVLSWVDLPAACADGEASMVPLPGGGCRLVLNRALLRAPTDAAALGIEGGCTDFFGVPPVAHNASYAARPQWLHADFVAVELLQRHVLPAVLRDIGAATKAAWQSDSGQPLRERLLAVVEKIAEFTYYLFNGALYTRGSAAIGVLSHHAMLLWFLGGPPEASGGAPRAERARHRLQALRCIPNWRRHSMPDIEASSAHTAAEYVEGAYWASFEAPHGSAREAMAACLEREFLRADAGAEARGLEDARWMKEALQALREASGVLA